MNKKRCIPALIFLQTSIIFALPTYQSSITPIPKNIQQKMIGVTWHKDCPVPLSDLAYVKLTYYGFDQTAHEGVLIVKKNLAREISDIFKILYQARFPVERMQPMYQFAGDDEKAMEANNTSSFNCRSITGNSTRFSKHSYGTAIDINTKINPYVKGALILPKNATIYADRSKNYKGKITKNDVVYKAFTNRGWEWGGDWTRLKDYQHFEKQS